MTLFRTAGVGARARLLLVGVLAGFLFFAARADAAITIGSGLTSTPTTGLSSTSITVTQTVPQGRSFASPVDGAVVLWRWMNPLGGSARARVLRPFNGGALFAGVGAGPVSTSPSPGVVPFTLTPPLLIRAGDYFGVDQLSNGAISFSNAVSPATREAHWSPALVDAAGPAPPLGTSNLELLVNADVEPATISLTGTPKAKIKTRKRKVLVTFTFSSNMPGLGFQCTRDTGPPSPCESPFSYAARLGSHTFKVQAADRVGPFGPSASFPFRVKRKKHRH